MIFHRKTEKFDQKFFSEKFFFSKNFFFDFFDEKSSENRFLGMFMHENAQKNFWKIFLGCKNVSKRSFIPGFQEKLPPGGTQFRRSDQKTEFTIVFSTKFWVYTDCERIFFVDHQYFRVGALRTGNTEFS